MNDPNPVRDYAENQTLAAARDYAAVQKADLPIQSEDLETHIYSDLVKN